MLFQRVTKKPQGRFLASHILLFLSAYLSISDVLFTEIDDRMIYYCVEQTSHTIYKRASND